jgi:hypothetical protein
VLRVRHATASNAKEKQLTMAAHAAEPAEVLEALPYARIDEMEREATKSIANQCAAKWGSDYEMQLYCRKRQNEAAKSFYNATRVLKEGLADPQARAHAYARPNSRVAAMETKIRNASVRPGHARRRRQMRRSNRRPRN